MVRAGEEFADRADAGPPVRNLHDRFGVEAMLQRPNSPHARYRRRRVHQNSIHIKQQRTATQRFHEHSFYVESKRFCWIERKYVSESLNQKEAWGGRRGLNPRHSVPQTNLTVLEPITESIS